MSNRTDDRDVLMGFQLPETTALLDIADALTDLGSRLQQAEGLARVCATATAAPTLAEQDLGHALGVLHAYVRALRQGVQRWPGGMCETPAGTQAASDEL